MVLFSFISFSLSLVAITDNLVDKAMYMLVKVVIEHLQKDKEKNNQNYIDIG